MGYVELKEEESRIERNSATFRFEQLVHNGVDDA